MQHTFIITGPQGSGKTTRALEIVRHIREKRLTAGGIAAVGYWNDGVRYRFDLLDLQTGNKIVFCQQQPHEGWEKIHRFYINPAGQMFGEKALAPAHLQDTDLILVDEIGPFEMQGKGWAIALKRIFNTLDKLMLITVREHMVEEIIHELIPGNKSVYHLTESTAEEVANDIASMI